jgi:hypothetical protein
VSIRPPEASCKPVRQGLLIGCADRLTVRKEDDMSAYEHPLNIARQAPARRRTRATVAQRLLLAIRRWQRSRAAIAFQALPDMYLEGIGMARGDIPRMAKDLFPAKGETVSLHAAGASGERQHSELRNAA